MALSIGIENFTVNRTAFTIPIFGGIEIRWYGIIITTGIILAFIYSARRAKQEGIILDDLLDIGIFTVIFAVVGARLYYVLTSLDEYSSFYDIIAIWNGGLAIYGAIIAGGITVFIVCRYKKINYLKAFDMIAPGVLIGQILGRWGNFFNGEAYGEVVKEGSPLYFLRLGLLPNMKSATTMYYFHPTFLYESLWNLVGFLIINALYRKKKFNGQIFLMYITWYGFGRMFIEGLRTDSLMVGAFRISQLVGFSSFVVGAILLVVFLAKAHREKITAGEYTPAFPKISRSATPEQTSGIKPESEEPETESANDDEILNEEVISDKLKNVFDKKD